MRYISYVVEGGFLQHAVPFDDLPGATADSRKRASDPYFDPSECDIGVWDCEYDARIFDALREKEEAGS